MLKYLDFINENKKNSIEKIIQEKINTITLNGIFYHGSSIQNDKYDGYNLIDELSTGYSDFEAIWITDKEDIANDFSEEATRSDDDIRCVYKLKLNNVKNIADIPYQMSKKIINEYELFDFRESIDILKDAGYNGWKTIGSIGKKTYEDFAIFYENLIYIIEVKFYINDNWTDYFNIEDATNFLKNKNK